MSLLHDLLAATPAPPIDVDIDTMLEMFEAMRVRRAEILGSIQTIPVTTDEDRVLIATIAKRQLAWLSALEAARERVREQRIATSKLRRYADGVG